MTRKQYMSNHCHAYRAYYAQFVTPTVRNSVRLCFGMDRLVNDGGQQFFNTIPLDEWDMLSNAVIRNRQLPVQMMRDAGETLNIGVAGCILREAARQLVEEHVQSETGL